MTGFLVTPLIIKGREQLFSLSETHKHVTKVQTRRKCVPNIDSLG